jgi:hypothetical protein
MTDPRLPTSAPAGSEAKIRVMEARRALKLPLCMPGDNEELARVSSRMATPPLLRNLLREWEGLPRSPKVYRCHGPAGIE